MRIGSVPVLSTIVLNFHVHHSPRHVARVLQARGSFGRSQLRISSGIGVVVLALRNSCHAGNHETAASG